MVVKNASTHAEICGRGAGCKGGHNAVEQSSYISREKMYCEYDGKTYYPKYSEDLVYNEVMLPDNAPREYADPKVLWNSVEMFEKNKNAQLARTYKLNLPNEWSYELAVDVMRDYVKRNFVDVGMCAQFAIHDSENTKGQRNLHCHIMLTLRSIDERGRWMDKSHKVDILDENGNRIPVIDPKTGQQKVDKQNRKQWKCKPVSTNDWNSKENAMKWRKDIVDTINSVNDKLGIKDIRWEYRSFMEQGLDIEPQIHLGPKASALEREGIRTERGDINRQIIESNSIILQARAAYEQAKSSFEAIKTASIDKIKSVKNEIIVVIREMAKKNNNRLKLPIINGQYLRLISNRESYQDKETMESFVHSMGWTSFEDFQANPLCKGGTLYLRGECVNELTMPASITTIGNGSFAGCGSIRSIVIPETMERVGLNAFSQCKNLTEVVVSSHSKTIISNAAFQGCSSLTTVFLPESVTVIGENAFRECQKLTMIAPAGSHAERFAKRHDIPFKRADS